MARRRRSRLARRFGTPSRRRIIVGRAARSAGRAAYKEKDRILAIAAAGALGYAETKYTLPNPIPQIGPAATYGIAAYLAARVLKSRAASHLATGLLAVAAYKFGGTQSGGGVSGEGDVVDIQG